MRPIFVSGNAKVGKNSCIKALSSILEPYVFCRELALATALRIELADLIREQFNISTFTDDPKEKELIRPIFVEYAEAKRKISPGGLYWVKKLEPQIREAISDKEQVYISDCRFVNEVEFAKREFDAILLHVVRYDENNLPIGPINSKEKENEPFLLKNADVTLKWFTVGKDNLDAMKEIISIQLKSLIEDIKFRAEQENIENFK